MHVPDGFLDLPVILTTYIVFLACLYVALSRLKRLTGETLYLASVVAAGIFAAQMLNWPVPGGTSLHFVGGALAGILLGPAAGFLSMLLVLTVQCVLFHDGGITALGANILNMAVVDVLAGYYLYRGALRFFGESRRGRMIGAFAGGWIGITLAGITCGLEIGASSSFPYGVYVSTAIMGVWHAALGIGEGIITALIVESLHVRGWHLQLRGNLGVKP